ncbi:MAG: IS66 family insertion sequence element accessory protein TnpA [Acidobacteriaceae bacterium]
MAERKRGKGSRRSEHEWRSLLSRHQSSGQGIEAFCHSEQISAASFYRWRGILRDGHDCGKEVGNNPAPAFVDLGALTPGAEIRTLARVAD